MASRADDDTRLFAEHLVPLFTTLEFEPAKWPETPAVGEMIRCVSRRVSRERELFFAMWRKPNDWVRFGFYFYERKELRHLPVDFAVSDEARFDEYRSIKGITEDQAYAFLAGCIVHDVLRLMVILPELQTAADLDEKWMKLMTDARTAWDHRFVRGALDPSAKPATVVFRSATMLLIAWDDQRTTFKFDTRDVPAEGLQVADFFTSPAGTRAPLTLRGGGRVWRFDYQGQFLE